MFGDSSCLAGSLPLQGLLSDDSPAQTTTTTTGGGSDLCSSLDDYTASLGKSSSAQNILALPFSSGTTGPPKATMLSHLNFIAMIDILRLVYCWCEYVWV